MASRRYRRHKGRNSLIGDLKELAGFVRRYYGGGADYLDKTIRLYGKNEAAFWERLNSNEIWGGMGSLADQFLVTNPGMPEDVYKGEQREFRELMIRIGRAMQEKSVGNARVAGWVDAFNHWNELDL